MNAISNRYEETEQLKGFRYGIIEVTTKCQCRCPGCYMVTRKMLNRGEMSLKQAVRIIDLCHDYLGHELETMDILGGEPLLWPHLKEYIEILLKRGIRPWIFTNMIAITPELAQWLFQREVFITGKLNIAPESRSWTSESIIQGKMLGRNERFGIDLFIGLEEFYEAGYRAPLLRVQNLIRKDNLQYVPDYYKYCLEMGIGTDLELMASGEGVGEEYWRVAPSPIEIAWMIMRIQAIRAEFGLEPSEVLMPHVFGSCPFYDKGLFFAVDGHIRACSNSTVILGNVNEPDAVKKAYESDLICNRLKLNKEIIGEPCCDCEKWKKCRGGCRATVEGMGDPKGGYSLCPVPYLA